MGGSQLTSTGRGDSARRPRRRRGAVAIPLVGAVVLAVLLGVAAKVLIDRERGPGCDGAGASLTITAAPTIKPALTKIVSAFNKTGPAVEGGCVAASVEQAEPAGVLGELTAEDGGPDVWIPDSSLWLSKLRKGQNPVQNTKPTSVAQSPIVLATPKNFAGPLAQESGGSVGWKVLAETAGGTGMADVHLRSLDPARNGAGLGAIVASSQVNGSTRGSGGTELIAVLRALTQKSAGTPTELFAGLRRKTGKRLVVVASEQDVWAHNKAVKAERVTALYPAEGTLNLDYPYLVVTSDPAKEEAAELLRQYVIGAEAQKIIQADGFRGRSGKAGTSIMDGMGVKASTPEPLESPRDGEVRDILQKASKVNLGTRMLALVDISGSMLQVVPATGKTRMEGITDVAVEGMANYPDNAEIGLWAFSTGLEGTKDHTELVPIGPLGSKTKAGVTRKQLIREELESVSPRGDTGLYDSIGAAYEKMTKTYKNDKVNVLVVFTDGSNDDTTGGISETQLLAQLKRQHKKDEPVKIITISFGQEVAQGPMRRITERTGGRAFTANSVKAIRKIFLQVVGDRI